MFSIGEIKEYFQSYSGEFIIWSNIAMPRVCLRRQISYVWYKINLNLNNHV